MGALTPNEIVIIVIAAAGLSVLAGYGISNILTRGRPDDAEDEIRRGAEAQADYRAEVRRMNRKAALAVAQNKYRE